ncbi:putative parvulin-type peptidyl-prolyl cis-trans isomerase precursor [Pseudomonas sp. 31 E 6]|uniref:Peptidylprolyl isomerase n=1 Tax=Pseudomonas fluorescens TaxID=294 RepID=A0A4Y9TDI9_PSEFL|nr:MULTISPECIES: peptidylprolyl isomerase [Pseudomonas]TFW40426.1 peptidylprolyl isomerase [Pseudomonas fluorescens]CRM17902.1 putative parvulin-type peptidyl-prolyl cis-trans isomerase precursor [Pseudomonas sp. 31 E 6]CRM34723.1 putative parvulin-type peptidyl-prolyl cis-trans isomerase precursor [Pseudomonas sp. 31 E 5]
MKKPTLMVGAGALALLVVAVGLSLRPGSDPVAAQQPAPSTSPVPGGPAVARLGNQQIDLPELNSVLASLPAETREQLRGNRGALETWIRSRLAQKAVLEQADAQGWRQRPEVEQQTRAATEQIVFRDYMLSVSQVPADYPSAAELQQAYDSGKAQWVTPPLYRVSQIFLAVSDPQALDAVRRQAQELSRKAQAAPGDFAALATQFSQDPDSAARGGDSGLQPLQQLVPPVREAVARLKVGAVSEAVQSPAGFHVLKLIAQQPARTATLDELRERLTEALRAQRQEQIAKAYLEGMLNTATLSIDGAQLSKVLE